MFSCYPSVASGTKNVRIIIMLVIMITIMMGDHDHDDPPGRHISYHHGDIASASYRNGIGNDTLCVV